MKKLFCTALLFLAGCAVTPGPMAPGHYTLHGDVQFTQAARECIQDAVDQWDAQTDGLADVNLVWDYDSTDMDSILEHMGNHRIQVWDFHSDSLAAADARDGTHRLAQAEGEFAKGPVTIGVVVGRIWPPSKCQQVVMHELGHAWGLDHTASVDDVMFHDVYQRENCLSKGDLLEFCKTNDCGSVVPKGCR